MKLMIVSPSPFARKTAVLVRELDLLERVTLCDVGAVTPVSNNSDLNAVNPLGMLPALELDNGDCLYDSPVICEYLNQLVDGPFFPTEPERRFHALGLQALGDGILDLSVALRYETALRPEALRWQDWIDHQNEKIGRALDALEQGCGEFEPAPTIGEITIACALGYLDFRFPERDWRPGRAALAQWFEGIMQRDSLRSTMPA